MTISHCEGALRPVQHTPVLSGELDATGWGAVMPVKTLAADELHPRVMDYLIQKGAPSPPDSWRGFGKLAKKMSR